MLHRLQIFRMEAPHVRRREYAKWPALAVRSGFAKIPSVINAEQAVDRDPEEPREPDQNDGIGQPAPSLPVREAGSGDAEAIADLRLH